MNNSGQLKTQNFMVFDSYTLLPEQKKIKEALTKLQIKVIGDGGQDQQFYCKFSNEMFLNIFLILLAGNQKLGQRNDQTIKTILSLMGQQYKNYDGYISIQKIKQVHGYLSNSIVQQKGEFVQLDNRAIESVLAQLQGENVIGFGRSEDVNIATKLKNKKMALIVFKVSNYFILGAFNCKSKKIIQTSEKSGFEFSLPETLVSILMLIMLMLTVKQGITGTNSSFKH